MIQQPSVWSGYRPMGVTQLADNLWLEPQHHPAMDHLAALIRGGCCHMDISGLLRLPWSGSHCVHGLGSGPTVHMANSPSLVPQAQGIYLTNPFPCWPRGKGSSKPPAALCFYHGG